MIAEVTAPYLEPHLEEQVRLVTEIFPIMTGIEVALARAAWPPAEPVLLAWVNFGGEWKGALVLGATLPLAFAFTARLMAIPLPAVVDDDVRDSIAELANTIAGNFKALLPSGCSMSVPVVELQLQDIPEPANLHQLCKTVFAAEHGSCCVVLQSGHRV
jgi:CheY-specific phosphatase CheX